LVSLRHCDANGRLLYSCSTYRPFSLKYTGEYSTPGTQPLLFLPPTLGPITRGAFVRVRLACPAPHTTATGRSASCRAGAATDVLRTAEWCRYCTDWVSTRGAKATSNSPTLLPRQVRARSSATIAHLFLSCRCRRRIHRVLARPPRARRDRAGGRGGAPSDAAEGAGGLHPLRAAEARRR
jgi:hypothetical protein